MRKLRKNIRAIGGKIDFLGIFGLDYRKKSQNSARYYKLIFWKRNVLQRELPTHKFKKNDLIPKSGPPPPFPKKKKPVPQISSYQTES